MGIVAVALVALIGAIAVGVDMGRLVLAAQRAQDVADCAARAAMRKPPSTNYGAAQQRIADVVAGNNVTVSNVVTYSNNDVTFLPGGTAIPGYGTLGPYEEAVTIYTHVDVPFYFAPALGLNGTVVTRKATCAMTAVSGTPITPIWVTETTPFEYGQAQNLLASDTPGHPGIPGNFGWLQPPSGSNDFLTLLQGDNVDPALLAENYVTIGDTVEGLTGVKKGEWDRALGYDGEGRLARASEAPWTYDTFTDFRSDNPRLMIVPICEYLGGNGGTAEFEIVKFGVWWLESIDTHGSVFGVTARFVEYILPGQTHEGPGGDTGLWTTTLVG